MILTKIFGGYSYRFDVPKARIYQAGRNIILDIDFPEPIMKYKVDRNAPLPSGEPLEKLLVVEQQ